MSDLTPISRAVHPTPAQITSMRRGGLNVFGFDPTTGTLESATLNGKPISPLFVEALLRQADRDLRGTA